MAIFRGDEPVSRAHVDRVGTFSGRQAFDLFINTGGPNGSGTRYNLLVELTVAGRPVTLGSSCLHP